MNKFTGSEIAKNGFMEQEFIKNFFNKNVKFLNQINKKFKINLTPDFQVISGTSKTDLQSNKINIQFKKTKDGQFGQIDRHWVSQLINNIPDIKPIQSILEKLCELPIRQDRKGRLMCNKSFEIVKIKTPNYNESIIKDFIETLEKNKKKIVEFAFYGTVMNEAPELFVVSKYKNKTERESIIVYRTKDIIKEICKNNVKIRPSGTVIEIGDCFTFQRKGGDGGKKSANQFQFKFIPTKINCKNIMFNYKV